MNKTTNGARSRTPKLVAHLLIFISAAVLFSSGCAEKEPITLGFVGGLSGRVSDLGGPARNGMLLAVEEVNEQGGINSKPVQTIIKDDKQNAQQAITAVKELIDSNVDAIIGPVTSSMAVQVAPLATENKTLMMGVTVTTNELTGKDDYFLRSLAPTALHAGEVADYLYNKKNIRSFSAAYDISNKAYSYGWVKDFEKRISELGGKSLAIHEFSSGKPEALVPLAKALVEPKPDIVLFVTNSVDAALLAKLVRVEAPDVLLGTSEWAGTERLIELGGRFIEGAYVPQYLDRESQDPEFVAFRNKFLTRFNHEPGFPGMVSYNATKVVLTALKNGANKATIKDAIIKQKHFTGIQSDINFDQNGDVKSKTFITQVQGGRFVVQNDQ
jgi:branched-chain amino acid transport system substrate-binding protein